MSDTPFFPAWRVWIGSRPADTLAGLRRCTLDKLEDRLGPFFTGLTALSPAAASARERPYSVRRTWWCFLWQMLQGNASCREVVRQLQAMLVLEGRPGVDEGTSAYCQARGRVPESLLADALKVSAQAAVSLTTTGAHLQGRVVKMIDGTTLTLPDTPENQAGYPQPKSQQPGCGFPLLNLSVVWSERGATILDQVSGDHQTSEMRRLHQLRPRLTAGDILVYDRAAGHYMGCALLQASQVDLISRVHTRKIDWREGQRLGPDERLVRWPKTQRRPAYLSAEEWATLPKELVVRILRVRVQQKGFRNRVLVLVTTLLDAVAYPAAEIAAAYLQRWQLELCLDDLKTTLGLDALRCLSPAMVRRELQVLLIAHNLARAVMAEAAATHRVSLARLSFTGTLATLRCYTTASAQARNPAQRRLLWQEILRLIATDLVPLRPNRWQPRAVKRRPKSYPRLNQPRHRYQQSRHGSLYRRPTKT